VLITETANSSPRMVSKTFVLGAGFSKHA